MSFLGIDLGTSEVKLLLIDAVGELVGQAGAPLQVSRPHPLWSEQAPQDWWDAVSTASQQSCGACSDHNGCGRDTCSGAPT